MKTITFSGKSSLSLLLCFAGLLSFAAPKARADEEKDPPTRVARISYVDGSVSLQPGGQGDWGSAARNGPMTIGDKIYVDKDSRAELQAGPAAIHLGSMTALSFLNLDQGITQMRLPEGSINFRVSELREGDLYEVDAPNLAFTVKQAGALRIDVSENGDAARVTAIRGDGEVTAGGKTYEVHSGERAEFNGTDNIQYSIDHAPGPDGLDRWAAERDLKEDRSVSGKYVSRDIPGYDDLDDYGTWRDEPEYGHVWYPAEVAPGWAPYSYGYWNCVNSHNVNAVTVASRSAFVGGQPINRSGVRISPAALKGAQVTNSVGLKPTQHSSLGAANIKSHVPTPSAAVQNRTVIARTAPAQGASHAPVRTISSRGLVAGRTGNAPVRGANNHPTNW